jgi:hypothetical protein
MEIGIRGWGRGRGSLMAVCQSTDPATIAAVRSAPRALIYLSVEWSVPERASRQAFFEAADRLSNEKPDLGIAYYLLEEETELSRDFMAALGLPHVSCVLGEGSLVWLEAGRTVAYEFSARLLGASGITGRSLSLWGGKSDDRRPRSRDDSMRTDPLWDRELDG